MSIKNGFEAEKETTSISPMAGMEFFKCGCHFVNLHAVIVD
jgi:hypothetical protein